MPADRIRVCALGLCFDEAGRVLVERGYDSVRDEHFYRGIGGGVEPGERAVDALEREWREELGLSLDDPQLLAVRESFFTHEGREGHEIVFVFRARVREPWIYEREEVVITEPESGSGVPLLTHTALWITPAALRESDRRLLPEGLLDLVAAAV